MDKVFHCRIVWIDNLRLFAILCVILYHSSQLVENKVYFGWIIESFNMALFFFLSGFTSSKSLSKIEDFTGLKDFIQKRFLRILLPCAFMSLLIFQRLCAYWFLLTLFYYLVVFACIKLLCAKCKLSKLAPYYMFLLLIFINVPKNGNDQEFILIFTIGLICEKNMTLDYLEHLQKYKKISLVICLCLIWLCILPFYKSFYTNKLYSLVLTGDYYTFLFRQIMALSFVIGCCIIFISKMNVLTNMSKWGRETLGMYIIHVTALKMFEHYHVVYIASNPIIGDLFQILFFIMLTMVTLLIVKILSLWKWTNFLVLGNKLE